MPIISRFYGIKILMFYDDHNPPHFHVKYGECHARMIINSLEIIEGKLSDRAFKMIIEWAKLHQEEIIQNWKLAKEHKILNYIDPLD